MKKKIVVGICGSIAAYKSLEVIRGFKKKGWAVRVIMTEPATKFITPLTLETVSENQVCLDMFQRQNWEMAHISLSEYADIILVVPATANILGKVASGICDDLLTCTILATKSKVIFAPAMNENMWLTAQVQKNVQKLKKYGYLFIGPEKGALASGKIGMGRLTEPEKIVEFVEKIKKYE